MSISELIPSIEKLPANIPYLKPNGSNWAIFQMRFCDMMKVTCQWAYFTGTKICPVSQDPDKPTVDEDKAIEKWEHSN